MKDFLDSRNFFKGLRLAALSTLIVLPYQLYSYFVGYRGIIEKRFAQASIPALFVRDIFLLFVALLISSTAGFAWSKGKGLVGFGKWEGTKKDLKWLIPLGIALSVITAIVFDKNLFREFLEKFPKNPFAPFRSAFFEEVICRFGIFSIAYRLSRSISLSIVIAAVFNVAVALKGFYFIRPQVAADLFIAILAMKFGFALFLGYFYSKKGLISTMLLQFLIGLKGIYFTLE